MRVKLLLCFLIVCALIAVESRRYRRFGRRYGRYRCRNGGRGLFCRRSRVGWGWGWRFWRRPSRRIVVIPRIEVANKLGGIDTTTEDLNGLLSLDGLKGGGLIKFNPKALTQFLTEQINYFKDKILFMLDDFGKPFTLKLEIPDFNLLNIMPDLDEKVTFALFDKKDGNNSFDILKVDNDDVLMRSRFRADRPTVLITHGFMASATGTSVTRVRDAYLKKRDFNVITVNWSPMSVGSYTIARFMVIRVGNHVGKLINFLYKHGMNPNTTILVGHSLGSHVMGFAGQTATPNVNHTIGLDPAWPLFVGLPISQRISDDDARHVEVIHTNGGMLGFPGLIGDYDFYPNGGYFQNGCLGQWYTACSHGRSYTYLAEQIEGEGSDFVAVQCDSYKNFKQGKCARNKAKTIMGGLEDNGAPKGSYYLDTNNEAPFGLGSKFFSG